MRKVSNLFRKFKHLGIYQWRDVFEVAKNDLQKDIMVFKFAKTELFSAPLPVDKIKGVWADFFPNMQQPVSIPNDAF